MIFEKTRMSLDYLHNPVTKETTQPQKLSTMLKTTFYRNLRKLLH